MQNQVAKTKKDGDGHKPVDQKSLEEKYRPISDHSDGNGKFESHRVLFDEVKRSDADTRIIMSDIPLRMRYHLAGMETVERMGDPERADPVSKIWRESYYVHGIPVNRGGRDDALSVGQTQAENEEGSIDKAMRDMR